MLQSEHRSFRIFSLALCWRQISRPCRVTKCSFQPYNVKIVEENIEKLVSTLPHVTMNSLICPAANSY